MRPFVLFFLVLLGATTASAQSEPPPERKSYAKAYTYALVGTVAPIIFGLPLASSDGLFEPLGLAAVAGGYFFGPAAGRIYATDDDVLATALLRLGGGLLVSVGTIGALNCGFGGCNSSNGNLYAVAAYGGLGVIGYSLLLDLIHTTRAVRDYNERDARVSFAPGFDARAGAPTLGLRVDF